MRRLSRGGACVGRSLAPVGAPARRLSYGQHDGLDRRADRLSTGQRRSDPGFGTTFFPAGLEPSGSRLPNDPKRLFIRAKTTRQQARTRSNPAVDFGFVFYTAGAVEAPACSGISPGCWVLRRIRPAPGERQTGLSIGHIIFSPSIKRRTRRQTEFYEKKIHAKTFDFVGKRLIR